MLIVVMLMMVVMLIMIVMAAMLVVVVILIMVVVAAMLVIVVILVMVMMAAVLMVVLILVMIVMAAMLVVMLVLIMVMMVVVLLLTGVCLVRSTGLVQQLGHKVALAVHDRDDLGTGQGGPVGGDDGGGGVLLGQQGNGGSDLILTGIAGAAQDDAGGMADLIVIELAEVLHIHFDLVDIGHGDKAVQQHRQGLGHALDRAGDIAQLADAGRLDEDAVGVVGLNDLFQRLAEIADQTAADAAGVQLVDLNTGLAHKAAVNADLAEFVLDQDDLFARERLFDELFDKGGLAGTEKAGENVDLGFVFSHNWVPLFRCL